MKLTEKYKQAWKHERRSGNSTRIADILTQELFDNLNEWVPIIDPDSDRQNNFIPDQYLKQIIINRLATEHYLYINKQDKRYGIKLVEQTVDQKSIPAYFKPKRFDEVADLFDFSDSRRRIFLLKIQQI